MPKDAIDALTYVRWKLQQASLAAELGHIKRVLKIDICFTKLAIKARRAMWRISRHQAGQLTWQDVFLCSLFIILLRFYITKAAEPTWPHHEPGGRCPAVAIGPAVGC